MKNIIFFPLLFSLTLWACGNPEKTETAKASTEPQTSEAEDGSIHLSPGQVKQAGLEFGSFTPKSISEDLRVNTELVVHTEHTAEVTAFSDGIISGLNTSLNASVRTGQVLATVRKPDLLGLNRTVIELEALTGQ